MPSVSRAQQKLMFATAGGAKTGVPKKVAKDFVAADKKRGKKKLPARKKKVSAPNVDAAPISDYNEPERQTVSTRKISNGHVITHSKTGGKLGYKRKEVETFVPHKPRIDLLVKSPKKLPASRRAALAKTPV